MEELEGFAAAGWALDVDRGGLTELDADPVVALERRLDDFLLHFAVERDGDLLADVVLSDVD